MSGVANTSFTSSEGSLPEAETPEPFSRVRDICSQEKITIVHPPHSTRIQVYVFQFFKEEGCIGSLEVSIDGSAMIFKPSSSSDFRESSPEISKALVRAIDNHKSTILGQGETMDPLLSIKQQGPFWEKVFQELGSSIKAP